MKTSIQLLSAAVSILAAAFVHAQPTQTPAGINLDSSWKQGVYEFAEKNLQHSAWGIQHYERNFLLGVQLAKMDNLQIDEDVLFAAAFLHDMGVFEPYVIADAEHSQTATENIESVLTPLGFPNEKLESVKQAILAHMFYANVPQDATAQVLHDADTLDFLGIIGVTRIVSLTSRHPWATDLATAIATLTNFSEQLPPSLVTDSAKTIGRQRVAEMLRYLETVNAQSHDGSTL